MKKIYSLLAMMMMAGAAFAQTISVTVDGNAVSNGETVECLYTDIESHPVPVVTVWEMKPHVSITSSATQEVTVTMDVTEKKGDNEIQNCFASCEPANSANNFVVSHSKTMNAGESADADIHYSVKAKPAEIPLHRNVLITVSAGSENMSFTLHMCWDPSAAAIEGVNAENADGQAYSISGMPVSVEALPAGAIYVKGGNKYIK